MSIYESVLQGLNEAIEYEKGNLEANTIKISVAPLPEIKAEEIRTLRKELNMTQTIFAAVLGVSVKTVEAWESGKNIPAGSARRMLSMMKSDHLLPEKYNLLIH